MKSLDEIIENTPLEWDGYEPLITKRIKAIAEEYASQFNLRDELLKFAEGYNKDKYITIKEHHIDDYLKSR